ncbi:MAG TPA: hypothetical protein VFW49_14825 [Fluviicoccus sp.]|nr:hypothetical protein [Fluviicoccus sp.]
MKELDDFLPGIRPYAPGVADPTAYFAIRQAAIEFCERTRMWQYTDEWAVNSDDCEGLLSPAGSVIHEIEKVWFDGHELRKVTASQLDMLLPNWRSSDDKPTGQPAYVTQTEPNTMLLAPYGAGTVRVSLILKPSQTCDQLPDFLADQHRETIAWGALARILLIPNQSFTNPEMGAVFGQSFQGKLDGKSTAGITGQQRAPVRTRASFL